MPTPGLSALYGITNSAPGSHVRNGFWFEMQICSHGSSVFTAGVSARAGPTRTSHICRSGWTRERSWLPRTPAAPAEGWGEALVKPRTSTFECKFIPAAVYWQKKGKVLLLRTISVLPCQSFARGGSAGRTSLVTMLSVCPAQKPHFCCKNVLFAFQRLL